MNRRRFLKLTTTAGSLALTSSLLAACSSGTGLSTSSANPTQPTPQDTPLPVPSTSGKAQVAFVKTRDRAAGVKQALELLEINPVKGKNLFLKPNFNSADAAPGSTHHDALSALVNHLQALGAGRITIGDRSGMGNTRAVMERKDIFRMAEELGFETLVFDDLDENGWVAYNEPDSHWERGFALPRPVIEADGVVQTCCLKTHRFGGHFTLSLKNSVGLAAKTVPGEGYNYMSELHGSAYQRHMIAEINAAYKPDLILLDGVEAFVDGGPDRGKLVQSEVILAGTDRIALDAVGVAFLRHFGTTQVVSEGPIFEQAQIARAVELGLGISSPDQIEFITPDPDSAAYAAQIQTLLT